MRRVSQRMKVNGERLEGTVGKALGTFLEEQAYRRERIAVEVNGQIIPQSQFDELLLQDTDVVEIVQFMGGG